MAENLIDKIKQAEETRNNVIARYCQLRDELYAEREKLKQAEREATRAGDVTMAIEIVKRIQDLIIREQAINDIIAETEKARYYSDSDCIEAANAGIDKYAPALNELENKYSKLARDLCKVYREMAITRQRAVEARDAALAYHSAMRSESTPTTLTLFNESGLKDIADLPVCNEIYGLLCKYYSEEADRIRAIAGGVVIPEFGR